MFDRFRSRDPEDDAISSLFNRLCSSRLAIPWHPEADQIAARSLREIYVPMQRLLSDEAWMEDLDNPALLRHIRQSHRQCYWMYLRRLRVEARRMGFYRAYSMASRKDWDYARLLRRRALIEWALCKLRWLGLKHYFGITTEPEEIKMRIDLLLIDGKFHVAA